MSSDDRFWAKVNKTDGCWLWTGSRDTSGYGLFRRNGKLAKAHRLSYSLDRGYDPWLLVLHRCDVRACVNPAHLFQGTALANARDRSAKGRHGVRPSGLVYKRRAVHA